jgi:hypothetical protein
MAMDFYRTAQLKPEATVITFASMTLFVLSQSNVGPAYQNQVSTLD